MNEQLTFCRVEQISDDCSAQITFDEIRFKAIRAAMNLQKLGFETDNVFALMARNSKDIASIVFASLFVGCPLNTIDPTFGKNELTHMLKTTKPRLMFCEIEAYDLVKECSEHLELNLTIFTIGGQKGESKDVESLFVETVGEDQFL